MQKLLMYAATLIALCLYSQVAKASQTALYEYQCEVVDIEDRDELLGDRVEIGDTFRTRMQTLQSVRLFLNDPMFDAGERIRKGFEIFELDIENEEVHYRMHHGVVFHLPMHDFNYEVKQLSRSGGECRNSLEITLDDGASIDGNLTIGAKYTFNFTNEECYGDLLFEHPDPILMQEWQPRDIIIQNDYANGLEEYKIYLRVTQVKLVETRGGEIRVKAFVDLNQDCAHENFEPTIANVGVSARTHQADNYWSNFGTDENGEVLLIVSEDEGLVDLNSDSEYSLPNCLGGPIAFEFNANADPISIELPLLIEELGAAERPVSLGADGARIGRRMDYRIFVINPTSAPIDGRVILTYDPLLRSETSTPAAQSLNNSTIIWNLPSLAPGERRIFHARMQVPKDRSLQDELLCASATVVDMQGAEVFVDRYCQRIVGLLSPIQLARVKQNFDFDEAVVAAGDELELVANFQNVESEIAENVWIEIPGDQSLDAAGLTVDIASHGYELLKQSDGGWRIIFKNINLAGVEGQEDVSAGFVRFRVALRPGLKEGDAVESSVKIQFEYAAPENNLGEVRSLSSNILIHKIVNTVSSVSYDAEDLSIMLYPNPGADFITVRLEKYAVATLTLRNTLGATVLTYELEGASAVLDLRALATGMYYLTVATETGVTVKPFQILR